jgi:hypothetical protein
MARYVKYIITEILSRDVSRDWLRPGAARHRPVAQEILLISAAGKQATAQSPGSDTLCHLSTRTWRCAAPAGQMQDRGTFNRSELSPLIKLVLIAQHNDVEVSCQFSQQEWY